MDEQPRASRKGVAAATFFVIIAVAVFGAAFYLLDGMGVVSDLIGGGAGANQSGSQNASQTADPTKLALPSGMPEDFALRLWQEQLDSQEMIGRLVSGDVASLRVDRIARRGDEAQLFVTVRFKDGPQASGAIGLRRYGSDWYIAGVSSLRNGTTSAPTSALPDLADVDIALLNTMIAENKKSQPVIAEYLNGTVRQVIIEDINAGPKTATMEIEMEESHGDGYANLVAIQQDVDGTPTWFLARFTKTGHNPPEL